jgi:hypothetical protein
MSFPHDSEPGDEELVRYLLGQLSEDDTARLDEASIVDDDVAARLRIVETDLIDSYVRGKLTGETLTLFEARYLSSPRRQEHVKLASDFVQAIDRKAARTGRATWMDRAARPAIRAWIMVAAALVIAASGVVMFDGVRLRSELRQAREESGALERRAQNLEKQLGDARAASAAAAAELERIRSSATAAVTPPGPAPEAPQRRPEAGLVALVLLPPTRAVVPVPTLAIPADADRVAFELRLESNDFARYQVALKNLATNHILWRSHWMAPRSSGDQVSVSVNVPAHLLGPQHYSLDLTGRSGDGRTDVIGSYAVRIMQP